MGLILKPDFSVSIDSTILLVTDTSGEYSLSNLGGWGATDVPNPDLAESCLVAVVVRKASTGDEYLTPITNQFVLDPAPVGGNAKITSFQFTHKNDGAHEFYLFRLRASLDQIVYDDTLGGSILEDDFYYFEGALYKMGAASVSTQIAPQDLIGELAVVSGVCEDFILPRLAVQAQSIYKDYRQNRESNCDDADFIFKELLKLQQDIQGSTYAYYSGLTVEAQDQAESLLDKYQLA